VEAPSAIRIGRDGLLVQQGFHRGTLLAHVAVEHGWNAEDFLKHTCLKAGLPADAWREPETRVEAYDVEEFGA
ncbi:MAG TPA: AMMECR1 domain-containing protein, partial [Anaeromyxobacteraceae bacterium]|nr:AMMECR1 domain-containing protein [Anaeromyxobacteraceae bacterium]